MRSPVLLDFPDSFETERLVLRCPRRGDGPMVAEAVAESLPELRPWMFWAQAAPSVDESEIRARELSAEWILRSDLPLYLLRKEDGAFVGGSGLHRMDWSVPRFEIGYWCRTRFVGQGYVSEAVRGIRDFAFRELHAQRVEVHCDPLNERSVRVAERTGFVREGLLRRQSVAPGGGLRDTVVYSLTRAEWGASPGSG